jgi:hypothetical protein
MRAANLQNEKATETGPIADVGAFTIGRRHSIGTNSYKHMQHELSLSNNCIEIDLNASLDFELHRSISRLFDEEDEHATEETGEPTAPRPESSGPRLTRSYSIGVQPEVRLACEPSTRPARGALRAQARRSSGLAL